MQINYKEKRSCSFYLPFHRKNVLQQSLCMYFKVFLPIKMQQVKLFPALVYLWRENKCLGEYVNAAFEKLFEFCIDLWAYIDLSPVSELCFYGSCWCNMRYRYAARQVI